MQYLNYGRMVRLDGYSPNVATVILNGGNSQEVDFATTAYFVLINNLGNQDVHIKLNSTGTAFTLQHSTSISFAGGDLALQSVKIFNDISGASTCDLEIIYGT